MIATGVNRHQTPLPGNQQQAVSIHGPLIPTHVLSAASVFLTAPVQSAAAGGRPLPYDRGHADRGLGEAGNTAKAIGGSSTHHGRLERSRRQDETVGCQILFAAFGHALLSLITLLTFARPRSSAPVALYRPYKYLRNQRSILHLNSLQVFCRRRRRPLRRQRCSSRLSFPYWFIPASKNLSLYYMYRFWIPFLPKNLFRIFLASTFEEPQRRRPFLRRHPQARASPATSMN